MTKVPIPTPTRMSASAVGMQLSCHASANLPLAIPGYQPPAEPETKASTKGDSLHKLMEEFGRYTPKEQLGIAKAMEYVATLRQRRRFTQLLEAESSGWWLPGQPKTRADIVLYVQDEIHIVDWKFGKIPVEVHGNAQLKYYALSFSPLAPKAKLVTCHIVQPFADNIESTEFTVAQLAQFQQDTYAAATAIAAGDTTFTPSDYCTFCPANPHSRAAKGSPLCPVMMKLLYPGNFDEAAALADEEWE